MAKQIKKFKHPPNQYYVYIWFRTSDKHVFYVGKGFGDRVRLVNKSKRNKYFLRYYSKYECDYEIIKDGLTEHEAYILENDTHQLQLSPNNPRIFSKI